MRYSARLQRLLQETEAVRRAAEDAAQCYRAALAERRRLSRRAGPELAARLDGLLAAAAWPEQRSSRRAAAPTAVHGLDIARETDNLARADRHLAEGEQRVSRQRDIVTHLRRGGHSTARAEELLAAFVRTLDAWQTHRNAIAGAISFARRRHPPAP